MAVDGADLLHLVGDQLVALVEKQDAQLLLVGERHGGVAIVDDRTPRRQHGAALEPAAREILRRRLDDLEFGHHRVAHPRDLGETLRRGGHHFRERAEVGEQRLGERLDVSARERTEENELQELIVGKRVGAGLAEAPATAPCARYNAALP